MESQLRQKISGDVRFDEIIRKVYSIDASIYEIEPKGVILPKSQKDIVETVKIASEHNIPIIPRGSATGVTGGCLGKGLILDTSKYLNRIIHIDWDNERVVCEPGVVQDDLNRLLAKKGYRLGPSTSTGNRATVGGMLGNNAAGAHSLMYGSTGDHAQEVKLVLADGTVQTFDHSLNQDLIRIRDKYRKEILNHFPKIKRMASGYYLPALIENNPCRLIAGSEGTLGITTQITFQIVPIPKNTILCALYFSTIKECFEAVVLLLKSHPIAIEMIDREIIKAGKTSPTMRSRMSWLKGNPAAVLAVEFLDLTEKEIKSALNPYNFDILNPQNRDDIWEVRKAGLELLLSKRSYQRAIAFMEDMTIPPHNLPAFMEQFVDYLKIKKRTAGIYGHVGAGCIHIRPFINLMDTSDRQLMQQMVQEVSDLVYQYNGVMSGEHGDGLVRSWLNKKIFTPTLYDAMLEVKTTFDPHNLMNPCKVVNGPPLLDNLRQAPQKPYQTFLDFSAEGGFNLAVDMCNGNGLCRKKESVMCPSFQATGDEYDSTRARAQVLRSILLEKLKPSTLSIDVLDLCLECKGCKKECPSQVDMAKIKSEALYQFQKENGMSLRSRLFAHISDMNRCGSYFPRLSNFLNEFPPIRWLLSLIGVTTKRPLPKLAHERFSKWYTNYIQPESAETVVLFNDTYCEFLEPQIGQAAVKVLNTMGYRVVVPEWSCCGRPLISKGCLPEAKEKVIKLFKILEPYQGLPILFLEPSCFSVLCDDSQGLVGQNDISKSCISLETFIAKNLERLPSKKLPDIMVHGHCHQKSLWGTSAQHRVMGGAKVIPAGCCGCAGSFGYEKEHYELSMKIGELKLFPEIRGSGVDTVIVANGFSCRSQIKHGTGIKAYHFIEVLVK